MQVLGDITADQVRAALRPAAALSGPGLTSARWDVLARVAQDDLALAKLVEPHADAVAILAELGASEPEPGSLWGVWAAEPPFALLTATQRPDGWIVDGTKAFCSGALLVSHVLVTASSVDGPRLLTVDLAEPGVEVDRDAHPWVGHGMQRAATHTVRFDAVPARAVGGPDDYTNRPGFWTGAIGIAACWLGGARGLADTLERSAPRLDAHGRAHLGAVRARLDALALVLDGAARVVDEGLAGLDELERLALSVRTTAADTVDEVVDRLGRALGPGPLVFDATHAGRVADLQVFVRQHHAERDLERLGSLGGPDV